MRFKRKKRATPGTTDSATRATVMLNSTSRSFPDPPTTAQSSPAPQITPPSRCPSPQVIEDRYIDDDKLLELCSQRFPSGSYKLSYKFNRWYLDAPDRLDERTLELCEIDMGI